MNLLQNTVSEIRAFYVTLFGFKNESKNQIIPINQSTVERQKYCLDPQRLAKFKIYFFQII